MTGLLKKLNTPRIYLLIANFFLVFLLTLLNYLRVIPLRSDDLAFIILLAAAFALYRPGWTFLFFVGLLPLENVNLAPVDWGVAMRPYQLIGALSIIAVLVRFLTGKLNFRLRMPEKADYLVIILTIAGFLSAISASDKESALKLAVIMASYAALYFLVRSFIQDADDTKRIVPFMLASSIIVAFYGIWQNIRFIAGSGHFEVMPGRPNATFTEAEWLGAYLVLIISMSLSVMFFLRLRSYANTEQISNLKFKILNQFQIHKFQISNYLLLTISLILLIITVSRSAWLGAFAATFMFIFIFFTDLRFRNWRWKETLFLKVKILAAIMLSLAAVYIFHLTDFQLFNRAQSTGTGLQKITISCDPNGLLHLDRPLIPAVVSDQDLREFNCRHINLEDVEKERTAGNLISEVYRKDPNVQTRSEIYKKSWNEIKKHPVMGIGWGNISDVLGKDGRGAGLNSSNIFLEVWLGTGLIGFIAFVLLWLYALWNSVRNYYFSEEVLGKSIGIFMITSWFGLTVFNLFNAGIFLGFLWAWLAVSQMRIGSENKSRK